MLLIEKCWEIGNLVRARGVVSGDGVIEKRRMRGTGGWETGVVGEHCLIRSGTGLSWRVLKEKWLLAL